MHDFKSCSSAKIMLARVEVMPLLVKEKFEL